jgi:hypothetical protein
VNSLDVIDINLKANDSYYWWPKYGFIEFKRESKINSLCFEWFKNLHKIEAWNELKLRFTTNSNSKNN